MRIDRPPSATAEGGMTLVSVTRLRIRSLRFMPGFALYALRSLSQSRRAPGFHDGSLLRDRKLTFWTMTVWRDQHAMRAYMASGAHLKAMPKLQAWCDEASVVHWTQDGAATPEWAEADRRMRMEGRASKVRRPSAVHASLGFAAPRLSGAVPIRPV
jgi:quinol monooxygenase YgiN